VKLPPLLPIPEIKARLDRIFPEGMETRTVLVREMSARAIFVFLYGGMVEGGPALRPSHIYFFTHEQSASLSDDERHAWVADSMRPGFRPPGTRWYADTTREPIRDETLRFGLVEVGAVGKLDGVPTTSSKPIYFLRADFAKLFHPELKGDALETDAARWRERHLSGAARSRLAVLSAGRTDAGSGVLVDFPDGTRQKLAAGPSSQIAKAVIEQFVPVFLTQGAVLWLSESADKVRHADDALASKLGLKIDPSKALPDVILVDAGASGADTTLVFVEIVATDGPMTEARKAQLLRYVRDSRFPEAQCVFGTAFEDRAHAAFRKALPALAWGSFAWFRSEPSRLLCLYDQPVSVDRWPFRGPTQS
jgi:hypothetical protein